MRGDLLFQHFEQLLWQPSCGIQIANEFEVLGRVSRTAGQFNIERSLKLRKIRFAREEATQ